MPRLRVLTGPSTSPDALEDISHLVNTSTPYRIQSDAFDGAVVVHILDFVGPGPFAATASSSSSSSSDGRSGGDGRGRGGSDTDAYFSSAERKGVTWSIQVRCVSFYMITIWGNNSSFTFPQREISETCVCG
jgi:hypothetical protein